MPARYGFGVLLLGVTSGCLTPEHRAPAASAEFKGARCEVHRITGSLVATRVCTLQYQREAIQQDVQDARDFINREKIAACPGPGCD
jgi:hypothetical protein